MRLHVAHCPAEMKGLDLQSWRVVVIDVTRATSTISQALASGARRVIPVATVEEAHAVKLRLLDESPLLGGERQGLRIAGFDLGNSPTEYTPTKVKGKTIIFTTTNGTIALRAGEAAREVLAGSFLNLGAVCSWLSTGRGDMLLLCAGRDGMPVLDDSVCAGAFAFQISRLTPRAALTVEAAGAIAQYQEYQGREEEALRESPSGQALLPAGLAADLTYCAQVNLLDVVPVLERGEITAVRRQG